MDRDFDAVASETVASETVAAEPEPVVPEQSAEVEAAGRVWEIPPAWALGAVKAVFVLPALKDPRWMPSDEEAEAARPAMQRALQAALNKYLPAALSKWAVENKEMLDLVGALALVGWLRYRVIQAEGPLPGPEKKPAEVVQMPSPRAVADAPDPVDAGAAGEHPCEVCGQVFSSVADLAKHECKKPS